MSIDKHLIVGEGGGKSSSPRTPIEAPNSLQSVAFVRIVDLVSEGEIEGLVHGDGRDIYFDEAPLYNPTDGLWNFVDVKVLGRSGTPNQEFLPSIFNSAAPVDVGVEITNISGGIIRTISDANVDAAKILLTVPTLVAIQDNGDRLETSIQLEISVQPTPGVYSTPFVVDIKGKNTSAYQRQVVIDNLKSFGSAPWNIKVVRVTPDSGSVTLVNNIFWTNYTELIYSRVYYPYSAIVGVEARLDQFSRVPERKYHIDGIKVRIPNNYNPVTRVYTGIWNGTMTTTRYWTNNPVWILYDLLTSKRYGYGLDEDKIDKGSFYSASQYCDVMVDDGFSGTVPRYTFNWQGQASTESFFTANIIASSFRSSIYWSASKIFLSQDRPADPMINVTNASVINGYFNYTSSSLKDRHNQIAVQWNDPNDYYKLAVEYIDDEDSIAKFGVRRLDTVSIGCTERSQAIRVGRWILDTEKYSSESVTYQAGLDHAGITPGDIVAIFDENYAAERAGGRVKSATTNTITLDAPVTIGAGTYEIRVTLPNGTLETKTVTTGAGTHTQLSISGTFSVTPSKESVWQLISGNLEPRLFRVINKSEVEGFTFNIQAIYHDPDKYARVEEDIYIDPPIVSTIPDSNVLEPPTTLTAEEYQTTEGTSRMFNVDLSWSHSADPRKIVYEVQYRRDLLAYRKDGETASNNWTIRNVSAGLYHFRVRTIGLTGQSNWLTLDNFTVVADTTAAIDITGLQVKGGGTVFDGRNLEFEWDEITLNDEADFRDYKIELVDADTDAHIRFIYTIVPEAVYTFEQNFEDTGGNPRRRVKVKAWCRDIYDSLSLNPAVATFENPAPDMSAVQPTTIPRNGYLFISWPQVPDNDMSHYELFVDTTSELIISWPQNTVEFFNVTYGIDYDIQIRPHDLFGPGVISQIRTDSPLQFDPIDIDIELRDSITISTDASYSGDLNSLYDRVFDSTGVTIANPSGKYIQYKFEIINYVDRSVIWSGNDNARIYIAYSEDAVTWNYLKAGVGNIPVQPENELLYATNEADAQTNYWQLDQGINVGRWPNNIICRYVRVYFVNSNETIVNELIQSRILISELAAIENLSAISANIGSITAGNLQSSDYSATEGMQIDLDNRNIQVRKGGVGKLIYTGSTGNLSINGDVTITGGSGLANLTDAGDLAVKDTVGKTDCDTTLISGGYIATNLVRAASIEANAVTAAKILANNVTATHIGSNEIVTVTANIGTAKVQTLHLAANSISNDVSFASSSSVSINSWTYGTWYDLFSIDYVISSTQPEYVLIARGLIQTALSFSPQIAVSAYKYGVVFNWVYRNVTLGTIFYSQADYIGATQQYAFTAIQSGHNHGMTSSVTSGGVHSSKISGLVAGHTIRLTAQAARIQGGSTATTTGDIDIRFAQITGLKR